MKIALPKLQTSHLSANEEALRRCEDALDRYDKGDYEGAQEVMRRLWRGVGERPDTKRLHPLVAAEVLLCVGTLTGWIGSQIQLKEAQETAKNLISESINYFESVGDLKKVAAARVELAYCYWREGEFNEARIMLREALQKLTTEGTTRARAITKLVIIENSAARHSDALKILTENASLFEKISNQTVKGDYHNELAITLEEIAASENRKAYFQRAIKEYQAADHHFKLAKNPVYRASVKNNIAVLCSKLSRFKEAHKYLDEARRLTVSFKDRAKTAQIDWIRAEVLIAQGKYKEAEAVARKAASILEKGGHQCLLADALIAQGIALARTGSNERAQFVFQRAIEAAYQAGALNKAGLAALTLVEEVSELSPATLQAAYERAREWLTDSQSQGVLDFLVDLLPMDGAVLMNRHFRVLLIFTVFLAGTISSWTQEKRKLMVPGPSSRELVSASANPREDGISRIIFAELFKEGETEYVHVSAIGLKKAPPLSRSRSDDS